MREKEIELYLQERARQMGGRAYKFTSPGRTGMPDRMVVLPHARIGFLELKAPGERPRREQQLRLRELRDLGCMAAYADTREKVDEFLCCLSLQSSADAGREAYLEKLLEAEGLI